MESLRLLKSAEPPLYLAPSESLSQAARAASEHIYSSLKPYTPKTPFERLLVNGFDAEQIWQQIDLQSQPLISSLRRELKRFEKNPEEISKLFGLDEEREGEEREREGVLEGEAEGFEELDEGFDDDEEEEEEEENEEESEEGEGEEDEEEGNDDGENGVEDRFLKIKELEEYMEEDEAREYGIKKEKKRGGGKLSKRIEDDEEDEEEEEDEDEEEDEEGDGLGIFGADLGDEEEGARYEDFYGPKKKDNQKRKPKQMYDSDQLGDEQEDDKTLGNQEQNLSTHEEQLKKVQTKIEEMEKANLNPKTWTMQGEITAAKRPMNSALEVDLDFEHNVRPTPVITEEVTASIEELIQERILEGHFDDVQKAPDLPSKAPKERKELDENKSKTGLAEIYEEEYVQKTGLVSTALSFSDEQKKEASILFKKLCLKLDALSHFHFTPKPVIEDMSIQTNVPALAMEEIAPLAVSDAAMLAPEEVFAGKGDIKEETELTQAERKRRRADKKRKFKAESVKKTATKKARESAVQNHIDGDDSLLSLTFLARENHDFQPWISIHMEFHPAHCNFDYACSFEVVNGRHRDPYLPFQIGLILVKSSGASSFGVLRRMVSPGKRHEGRRGVLGKWGLMELDVSILGGLVSK
ncbi:hypothetical protein RHGRI_034927 [Rhododendron griersonianum]|uniref:Uncharacterized protein n=1 Tax=Rhododendron griersonianum TaxID=479676 RepID=A0AAV6I6I1_9ERIC|nr:hypothetical protein RHGRI_034927 [Rhododendron griersonianum]